MLLQFHRYAILIIYKREKNLRTYIHNVYEYEPFFFYLPVY